MNILLFTFTILVLYQDLSSVEAKEDLKNEPQLPSNISIPIIGRDGRIFLIQSLFWPWNTWSPFSQAGHAICKETCLRLGKGGGHYIIDFDPDLAPSSVGRCDCNCPAPKSTDKFNLCPSKVACANFCIYNTYHSYGGGSCGMDNRCTCNCNLREEYDIHAVWNWAPSSKNVEAEKIENVANLTSIEND